MSLPKYGGHSNVTASLIVDIAVIVLILNSPEVTVVCMIPPENVAVMVSGYLSITIPEPIMPPLPLPPPVYSLF